MDQLEQAKIIGERVRSRRLELNLTQEYLAEKMGVNKSTIQRYEVGRINNTKRLVLEGLASALRVTPEYLRGETDDYGTEADDRQMMQIMDLMEEIKDIIPLGISKEENLFAENILLLLLSEYKVFAESFTKARHRYTLQGGVSDEEAKRLGFGSRSGFYRAVYQESLEHSINTFFQLSEILRNNAHEPEMGNEKIRQLLE